MPLLFRVSLCYTQRAIAKVLLHTARSSQTDQFNRKFYKLDILKKYKWYWRLEPDVDFTCAITYDPFVQMARHKKVYGFTIALWEVGKSCPSLFRHMADWKEMMRIPSNGLWKAMVSPSWVPFPLRKFMSWLPYRDAHGDEWNLCHYWSNFEIADMDFFRTRAYQELFDYLDKKGGFYFERVSSHYGAIMYRFEHIANSLTVG